MHQEERTDTKSNLVDPIEALVRLNTNCWISAGDKLWVCMDLGNSAAVDHI